MGKPPIIDADFEVVSGPDQPAPRELEPGEALFDAIIPPGSLGHRPYIRSVAAVAVFGLIVALGLALRALLAP